MATVDPDLQRGVEEALDLGFGCFGGGDQAPFVMLTETSGKRHLIDLKSADGTISDALLEVGRGLIREFAESGQYYFLVWDGYLTKRGKRQDAVFAEAGARGEGRAIVFAQRYKQAKSGVLAKIGRSLVVAKVEHLWADGDAEQVTPADRSGEWERNQMSISLTNGDRADHEKHNAEEHLHTGGDVHELHDFFLDAGILSERSGNLPAALSLYEQAIQSEPDSALAWYNYGDILLALERFEEAVPALRKAVGLSPKTCLFHYDLGLALFNLGRHDEASKEFAAIIASDPQLERASSLLLLSSMTNLALCQDKIGRSIEAAKVLAPARRTAVDIIYNLGRFNYRAKRLNKALSFARAAELLTPKSEEVVHLLGSVLMDLKRHQEAVEVLTRATKLNPRCASAWYDLGVTLTRLKKNKKARPYFQKSLCLDPTHGWTYYCLACLDALERKSEAAFANLELAIAHGFRDAAHLRRDSDLRSLRRDARWKTIVQRAND